MNHDLDVILQSILREIVNTNYQKQLELKKLDEEYAYLITVKQQFSTFRWVTSHGFHEIFTIKPVDDHIKVIAALNEKLMYQFKFEDLWSDTRSIRYEITSILTRLIDPPREFPRRPDGPPPPEKKSFWRPFREPLPPTSAEWHAIDRLADILHSLPLERK